MINHCLTTADRALLSIVKLRNNNFSVIGVHKGYKKPVIGLRGRSELTRCMAKAETGLKTEFQELFQ